jgi:hypothetical protein
MGSGIRSVSVAHRRARLAVRHHLAPWAGTATVTGAAADLIALHGTDPSSVYLAAQARISQADCSAIDHALYEERSLVRMLGMRRTMFVVPTALAPLIQAACTDQVADRMRKGIAEQIRSAGIADDGLAWLDQVGKATVQALIDRSDGSGATGAELAQAEPRLRKQIIISPGKSYGGPVSLTSRILMLLSAEGRIVRGRPRGGWTSSQYLWFPAAAWLPGHTVSEPLTASTARTELARRWLRAFGPAQIVDLQWWTGWTAGQVKAALGSLRLAEVDLNGISGVMLDDDDPGDPAVGLEPWSALLPALDPTAMGWRDKSWYLSEHTVGLFDRSGNIGPTVWWDGQVVGGWAQRRDGEIVFRLLTDTGTEAASAIALAAQRLQAWIWPTRVTPRFRTPLERELSA